MNAKQCEICSKNSVSNVPNNVENTDYRNLAGNFK